jgi:transposase-like protein
MAIALMCEGKKGISANQMKRHLGVTYKTAWFVCHRIRKAMSEKDITPLGGQGQIIEIDETFIGGRIRGGGRDGKHSKLKVFGIAERGGRVHLQRVENVRNETLKPIIDAWVSPNASQIVTDGLPGYKSLIPREKHVAGNHYQERRKGLKLSNPAIEGAFSLFKRGIIGQYHQLGIEHLDAYLSEFSWRFSRRHFQYKMFDLVLSNLTAKQPLPYKQLTAKSGVNDLPPF